MRRQFDQPSVDYVFLWKCQPAASVRLVLIRAGGPQPYQIFSSTAPPTHPFIVCKSQISPWFQIQVSLMYSHGYLEVRFLGLGSWLPRRSLGPRPASSARSTQATALSNTTNAIITATSCNVETTFLPGDAANTILVTKCARSCFQNSAT